MQIYIGHEDIKLGVKNSVTQCPISLALKRKYPMDTVNVYWNMATIFNTTDGERIFILPSYIKNWIKNFDKGEPVQPIRFRCTLEKWKEE